MKIKILKNKIHNNYLNLNNQIKIIINKKIICKKFRGLVLLKLINRNKFLKKIKNIKLINKMNKKFIVIMRLKQINLFCKLKIYKLHKIMIKNRYINFK